MPCALRELDHLAHRHLGRDRDRVAQHAGLVALDARHLGGLLLRRQVLVDDADAAFLRQGDRQAGFGHGVHRRRDERQVEADVAGEGGREIGVARQDARERRHQQHVVERQRFAQKAHGKLRSQKRIIRMQVQSTGLRTPRLPGARRAPLHCPPILHVALRRPWPDRSSPCSPSSRRASIALPAEAQWKWRDKSGHVQYSDLPPPAGTADQDILAAPEPVDAPRARRSLRRLGRRSPRAPRRRPRDGLAPQTGRCRARGQAQEGRSRCRRQEQGRSGDGIAALRADNCSRATAQMTTLESGIRLATDQREDRRARVPRRQAARRRSPAHARRHRRRLQVAALSGARLRALAGPQPARLLRIDQQRSVDLDAIAVAQARHRRAAARPQMPTARLAAGRAPDGARAGRSPAPRRARSPAPAGSTVDFERHARAGAAGDRDAQQRAPRLPSARAMDLLGALHERIDEGVGDAVEHRADRRLEDGVRERVAQLELDLAGAVGGRRRPRGSGSGTKRQMPSSSENGPSTRSMSTDSSGTCAFRVVNAWRTPA